MTPFFQKFASHVWYMTPDAWQLLGLRAQQPPKRETEVSRRPVKDASGDEISQLRMVGKIGIVPIRNAIMKGATGSEKYEYGITSHEDIREDIDNALANGARNIVFDVNSPGGTAQGNAALANYIADLRAKHGIGTYSFTDSMMCSAAEYITSACYGRFATSDAVVGSIGSMMGTVSVQGMLERIGIEFSLFTSGKYKGMGHMAKDLSDAQKEFLQAWVNKSAAEFKNQMTSYRKTLKAEAMEGQFFSGREGAENGLIDCVVGSMSEVIRYVAG
jgi:signal peptide peptidase SppA